MKLHLSEDLALPADAITHEDLAWAAGLFEGEGTITIAVRNCDDTFRLVCIIGNTDRQVLDFFQSRWPGWYQPPYGERPGRKPSWSWTVAGPAAERFLREIGPAFRTDRVRKKCEIGLKFRSCQSRSARVHQAWGYKAAQRRLYQEMRDLNRRGAIEGESS